MIFRYRHGRLYRPRPLGPLGPFGPLGPLGPFGPFGPFGPVYGPFVPMPPVGPFEPPREPPRDLDQPLGALLRDLGVIADLAPWEERADSQRSTVELVRVLRTDLTRAELESAASFLPIPDRGQLEPGARYLLVGPPFGTGLAGVPGAWPAGSPPAAYGLPFGIVGRTASGTKRPIDREELDRLMPLNPLRRLPR